MAWGRAALGTSSPDRESPTDFPHGDQELGLIVVSEARLDNRRELEVILGCNSSSPNSELLGRGYRRWGPGLADRLDGDFAFVVWDVVAGRLYAARDPFGSRPLYYVSSADRFLVSNDVEALVGLVDRRAIDSQTVYDYLTGHFSSQRRTFFAQVARLQPGHYLIADGSACRQIRYFFPPTDLVRLGTTQEYEERFRELLSRAVAARLDSRAPLVAHLSGGLDSTSIVLLADEIYRKGGSARPPLTLASAVFPGLDCDESEVIDATVARTSFPAMRWVGYDQAWESLDRPNLAWPGSPAPISGGSTGDLEISRRLGAEVILSGSGGDEVSYGGGVFRDLAASGRWLTLYRETLGQARFPRRLGWSFLKDSAVGLIPDSVRKTAARMIRRPPPPPAWLADGFHSVGAREGEDWDDFGFSWRSWVQRLTWRVLTTVTTGLSMDYRVHYGRQAGIEFRFPFLDRQLVSFVLAVPWQHRIPRGYMRRLQWKALEDRIPGELFLRGRITTAESARARAGRDSAARYRTVFEDSQWAAGEFLDQKAVRRLLDAASCQPASTTSATWQALGRAATLEVWLRDLFRYSPPPET